MPNAVYHLTDWSHTNAFIDPQSQAQIILFNELAAETESLSRGSFIRRLIDKLLAPELSSDDSATGAATTGSAATGSAATGAVSAATVDETQSYDPDDPRRWKSILNLSREKYKEIDVENEDDDFDNYGVAQEYLRRSRIQHARWEREKGKSKGRGHHQGTRAPTGAYGGRHIAGGYMAPALSPSSCSA